MLIRGTLRDRLRRSVLAYRAVVAWRRRQTDARIAREQRDCARRAAARRWRPEITAPEAVFARVAAKLRARGLQWPPAPRQRPLHILYASVPGNWERHNIPPELARLGDVSCFFLEDQGVGADTPPRDVRQLVADRLPRYVAELHARRPIDLILTYLSGASIAPATIRVIGRHAPVFSFHLDDRRGFYGRHDGKQWSGPAAVCAAYDLNLSNASASLVKYHAEGGDVLFWPEGANPEFFRPLPLDEVYDVTFCGQRYGVRPFLVNYLRRHGVNVQCFGAGWENGFVADEEIVRIANQSRVSLGFGYVNESTDQCLKGRDFELPACGAVYLTSDNPDLGRVFAVGTEIESYRDYRNCLQKVRRLLAEKDRRASLRRRARAAVVERHTWAGRVRQLLQCEGAPPVPPVVAASQAAPANPDLLL